MNSRQVFRQQIQTARAGTIRRLQAEFDLIIAEFTAEITPEQAARVLGRLRQRAAAAGALNLVSSWRALPLN